jgi:hypothetical protein
MKLAALLTVSALAAGCGPIVNVERIDFRAENVRAIEMEQERLLWRAACENDCMNCEYDRALNRTGDDRSCHGSRIDKPIEPKTKKRKVSP